MKTVNERARAPDRFGPPGAWNVLSDLERKNYGKNESWNRVQAVPADIESVANRPAEHLNISRLSARQYMYMYTCRLDSSLLLPCLCFHLSAGEEVGLSGRDSIHTRRNSNSYLAESWAEAPSF